MCQICSGDPNILTFYLYMVKNILAIVKWLKKYNNIFINPLVPNYASQVLKINTP